LFNLSTVVKLLWACNKQFHYAEEFSALIIMKGTVAGIGLFGCVESPMEVAQKLIHFVFHISFLHCFHSELGG